MRSEGCRANRGVRGGRYRRGVGLGSYHRPHYPNQGFGAERKDQLGSEDEEQYLKENLENKARSKVESGRPRSLSEDSRISKQLRRLSREESADRFLELIKQLEETLILAENIKYVRRNSDHILESLFENLHSAPSKSCKWEVAGCIGLLGHIMDIEVERFVELSFNRLDIWTQTEEKVLVLRSFYNLLALDVSGLQTAQVGNYIVNGLHRVLETTETMEVMVITVDILRKIHFISSSVLAPHFQDIVDILIGWHIDYSQPSQVTSYVSLSLQNFTELWPLHTDFANTLLSQFIEDMDDYLEDSSDGTDETENDFSSSASAKKFASFISVFTTIIRCLDIHADPTMHSSLTTLFYFDSLHKMIEGAKRLFPLVKEEALLHSLNQLCVVILPFKVDGFLNEILSLLDLHKEHIDEMTYTTQLSFLSLSKQTIKQYGSSLNVGFAQQILGECSAYRKLQMSPNEAVWNATLHVFHALFALKNIPLLQEAYRFVLLDMQEALSVLCPEAELLKVALQEERKMEALEVTVAEIQMSYSVSVLAEVANTRNSIITMWALSPSLVELLATQLGVSTKHLAANHPQVQQNILYLLYSHCSKHSHYISSSCMVVGSSPSFLSSSVDTSFSRDVPTFSSSSSTSENLSTIIHMITSILKLQKVASVDSLCLCIKWATEILIGCDSSLPLLLQKREFKEMLSAFVTLGYHFLLPVTLCVIQSLSFILSVLSFNQIYCLEDIVHLCLYHCNHSNEEVRSQYVHLLTILPLRVVTSAILGSRHLPHSEYISNKGEGFESLKITSVDYQSVVELLRYYLLHPTVQLPATSFHTIMHFILHGTQPQDKDWMKDIFAVNQRVQMMTKPEDWTFSLLGPQFKVFLWKWIVWESAQHCVTNKLKTTLGKPYDTFTSIESALKNHAKDACLSGTESQDEGQSGDGNPDEKTKGTKSNKNQLLSVFLLVEFVESLEKVMFNASDGCAIAPHPTNKSVRIFFMTNRQTCNEWLNRIRAAMITVTLSAGLPQVALRNSYKLLSELGENGNTEGGDFERAICYCVKSLIAVGCQDAIMGLYFWSMNKIGRKFPWIKEAALVAARRYEDALKGFGAYIRHNQELEIESSGLNEMPVVPDPFVLEFIHYQVTTCYSKLQQWENIKNFGSKIWSDLDSQNIQQKGGDLNFLQNLSHIEALSHFAKDDTEGILHSLNDYVSSFNYEDPGPWSLWKRTQNVGSSLLYALASLSSSQIDSTTDIMALLKNSQVEEERTLELSLMNPHPQFQIHSLLNLQIIAQLMNIIDNKSEVSHLHENWENLPLDSLPFDTQHLISCWTRAFGRINKNISQASVTKFDLITVKCSRKYENYQFAERTLIRLFKGEESASLLAVVQEFPADAEFTVLSSKLHREAAKMLACTGKVKEGCEVLASIVLRLNPILATLANQDPSLLSLPPNEAGHICAKSILTLNKWWNQSNKRDIMKPLWEASEVPDWMQTTFTVYQNMKKFLHEELTNLSDMSLYPIPQMDANMGCFLSLATIQCPSLPKVWYHIASWAFKWGRHIICKSENQSSNMLYPEDISAVTEVLASVLSPESLETHVQEVVCLLGSSRRRERKALLERADDDDDDLMLEEVEGSQQLGAALSHMFLEWGVKSNQLTGSISRLLEIRCLALSRNHAVLTTSAKAYFKFLKIGEANIPSYSDQQMIATLRLLRLIVKHASELQEVLEKGLSETPTTPWRAIIPQLFARLNHPEPYVRGSISDLLCRLAQDCPHLIIFPAVVGSSGVASSAKEANFTDMFAKYFPKKEGKASPEGEEFEGELDEDEEKRREKVDDDEEDEDESAINSEKDREKRTLIQNCFSTLVNTLKKQVGASIAEVQTLIHELRRITVLWDELWLGTLTQHHSDITRKCQQLKTDIVRLNKNASLSKEEKSELIKKKYEIIFQPLVFVLDQLIEITSATPETPHEKNFQETFSVLIQEARQALISPEDILEPSDALTKLRHLHQLMQQRAQKRSASSLKMAEISPILGNLTNTQIAMPGVDSPSNEIVSIASVCPPVSILPTKTKPKKLSFQGSNGKRYTYLFKGLEDLHLDQRIMQFLATVNTMLSKDQRNGECTYRAHYYSVVPLGARSGLIQWVGNATPLFGLYKRWQQRDAQMQALKGHSAHTPGVPPPVPSVARPSELYYSKLSPRLKEAGISLENRKDWPVTILREVFDELVKETPSDLLSRELWQTSVNASEWWNLTYTYNISTAVMSIIGYVIGLGDRHLDNLLVNLASGEVIHIDYNVCFEKGRNLRVPEKVPYRMTQNIESAFGVTGVEGIFRSACEYVMRVMRGGRETLLTLLEAFVYDPLVDWTPDSEAGYAGAVYGGDQALVLEARHNRQRLERGLTITMFTVRLAEMKADWIENKNCVLQAIPKIIQNLEKWQNIHHAVAEAESNLQQGHFLMAMMKEAEANPQHQLYDLMMRYQEYTVVKNTIQNATEFLLSKMTELKKWQQQYKMADKMFKGGLIKDLRAKLLNIGPLMSSVTLIMDYLNSSGQAQLARDCDLNEMDLKQALNQVVTMGINALEQLGNYGSVWVNYPSDHLEVHRISRHFMAVSTLYENLSLENVQLIIAKSHQEISDDPVLDSKIGNMEVHFQTKILQLNNKLQKIYDTIQEDGLANADAVVSGFQESLKCLEQGPVGSAAVCCALLNSLSQILAIRLREDKAVASMGDNLSDMMIGDLWWFNETMVSLGSVWELVSLLNKNSPPSSPSEMGVFKSLFILQDVFSAIQDLIVNTSHIIVVEGGRLFSQRDPSVISIASRLQEVVSDGAVPISTLCQQLTHHLHMTIFRMPSIHESSVHEANHLHGKLINIIQQITDMSFSTSDMSSSGCEMTQGQMLLMGFHLLFETVDTQLDRLIDALAASSLPHPWPRVDMIRLSTEIMGPLFDPSLREVVRAILRVKKVQAIAKFFSQSYHIFADSDRTMNSGPAGSEEDQLLRVVRGYAGECIYRLLLGLPSYLMTHLVLIHAQKLGVDVTGYIESHDVGTEGRVPLEGLVEEALEKCISQKGLQSVIATAASTVSAHLAATRRKLLLKQWENEMEGVKILLQRVSAQQLSFHWYYEEKLQQRGTKMQLKQNRAAVVNDIRNLEANLGALNVNVKELREKFDSYTTNVTHRLKWAAGSNPNTAEVLDKFCQSVEAGLDIVNKVLKGSDEVRALCTSVWHYEAMKSTCVEALSEDKHFTTILNKTQESCLLVQRYTGNINSQEELLIVLCPLPEEITPSWVQLSAAVVSDHLASLTHIVSENNSTLKLTEEAVHESVDELKLCLTIHHKLMSDVRVLLKSLAKFEQEGGMQGVDNYFCLYRRYSEVMSGLIRQLLHEPFFPDKIPQHIQKLQQLLLQTYVIYDKLVEFGTICIAEESRKDEELSSTDETGRVSTFSLKNTNLFSRKVVLTDVASRAKRHPITGKVIQEHNEFALNVWKRVKTKLEGRESASGKVISVNEQVNNTIEVARDLNNLATLYEGWTPWV